MVVHCTLCCSVLTLMRLSKTVFAGAVILTDGTRITGISYADDTVLIADLKSELREMVDEIKTEPLVRDC